MGRVVPTGHQETDGGQSGARGGQAAWRPCGRERTGGDATSPSRASVPELPAVGMDAVGAAVLVCAADGTIVDLNRAAALLLGVDPAAARGTSLREVRRWAGTWVTESGDEIAPAASTVARLAFSGERVEGEVVGLLDSGREHLRLAAHLGRAAVLAGRRARGRRPDARRHHRAQGDQGRAARDAVRAQRPGRDPARHLRLPGRRRHRAPRSQARATRFPESPAC